LQFFLHMVLCGGWLGFVAGCGGAGFTTGGADASGGDGAPLRDASLLAEVDGSTDVSPATDASSQDGGALEAGIDASPSEGGPANGVKCGPAECSGTTPVCCASGPTCAHVQCGCGTQLACARNLDCPAVQPACCIDNRQDLTCTSGHFIAACAIACRSGALQVCDPNGPPQQCLTGKCSTDMGDLSNVGLLPNSGLGVCK
jgi:hypothetical protein